MDHPTFARPPKAPKPLTITKRAEKTGPTRRPDAEGGTGRYRPDPPPPPRPNRTRSQGRRGTAATGAGRADLPSGRFRGLSRPPNEHRARKPGEPAGWKAGPTGPALPKMRLRRDEFRPRLPTMLKASQHDDSPPPAGQSNLGSLPNATQIDSNTQ